MYQESWYAFTAFSLQQIAEADGFHWQKSSKKWVRTKQHCDEEKGCLLLSCWTGHQIYRRAWRVHCWPLPHPRSIERFSMHRSISQGLGGRCRPHIYKYGRVYLAPGLLIALENARGQKSLHGGIPKLIVCADCRKGDCLLAHHIDELVQVDRGRWQGGQGAGCDC